MTGVQRCNTIPPVKTASVIMEELCENYDSLSVYMSSKNVQEHCRVTSAW